MMNAVIKTALSVRSTALGQAEPTGQSRAVSRIYTRLESGEFGVLGACRLLALSKSESPIVLIEMVQSHHGFGFAYVDIRGSDEPQILVAGVVNTPYELPLPTNEPLRGCVNVMRAGLILIPHTVDDIFGPIVANVGNSPPPMLRPGWELDVDQIAGGMDPVTPSDPYASSYLDFDPGSN